MRQAGRLLGSRQEGHFAPLEVLVLEPSMEPRGLALATAWTRTGATTACGSGVSVMLLPTAAAASGCCPPPLVPPSPEFLGLASCDSRRMAACCVASAGTGGGTTAAAAVVSTAAVSTRAFGCCEGSLPFARRASRSDLPRCSAWICTAAAVSICACMPSRYESVAVHRCRHTSHPLRAMRMEDSTQQPAQPQLQRLEVHIPFLFRRTGLSYDGSARPPSLTRLPFPELLLPPLDLRRRYLAVSLTPTRGTSTKLSQHRLMTKLAQLAAWLNEKAQVWRGGISSLVRLILILILVFVG
jgi:hypothetical protein